MEWVFYGGMKFLNVKGVVVVLMDVYMGEVIVLSFMLDFDFNDCLCLILIEVGLESFLFNRVL